MPTVLTWKGLRVVIYFNDHRPAHVHVIGGGCEAVFRLDCPSGTSESPGELWIFTFHGEQYGRDAYSSHR